jgi:hypothetical protein
MADDLPSQEPEHKNAESNPQDKGDQAREHAEAVKIAVTRTPSDVPPTPSNASNPNGERKESHKAKPNWVEILTLVLEILGIVGLVYYCWVNNRELQVSDSERQTMEKEFKASAASEIIAQRAWVFVTQVTGNAAENKDRGNFIVKLQNTGRTPALNVHTTINFDFDPKNIPIKDEMETNPVTGGTLAPNAMAFTQTAPIPFQMLTPISSGKTGYVSGTIWYDDIYGNHHWSQFCVMVTSDMLHHNLLDAMPTSFHNSCDDIKNAKGQ